MFLVGASEAESAADKGRELGIDGEGAESGRGVVVRGERDVELSADVSRRRRREKDESHSVQGKSSAFHVCVFAMVS